MEHITALQRTTPNICLSGGAAGADLEWGQSATLASHALIHWTFPTHRGPAPPSTCIPLSDTQLSTALPAITLAAKALRKSPPRNPHIRRLTLRNYFQVRWATSCYAVTVIQDEEDQARGAKVGGTAWATAMFAQMNAEGGQRRMWVFCQRRGVWLRWGGDWAGRKWEVVEGRPPRPEGVWAGIGSRVLEENGRRAIRELMGVEGGEGIGEEKGGAEREGEKEGEGKEEEKEEGKGKGKVGGG